MARGARRGIERERALQDYLEVNGWFCMRAAGSLGPLDILAVASFRAHYPVGIRRQVENGFPTRGEILLIQVKSTKRPYERFGPADRVALLQVGHAIGASCWLAHKPKGAPSWKWISASHWPGNDASSSKMANYAGTVDR